jgi:hypothetical protein
MPHGNHVRNHGYFEHGAQILPKAVDAKKAIPYDRCEKCAKVSSSANWVSGSKVPWCKLVILGE